MVETDRLRRSINKRTVLCFILQLSSGAVIKGLSCGLHQRSSPAQRRFLQFLCPYQVIT